MRLGAGLGNGLAHLARDHDRDVLRLGLEQVGRRAHPLCALRVGLAAQGLRGGVGRRDAALDLVGGVRLDLLLRERTDRLAQRDVLFRELEDVEVGISVAHDNSSRHSECLFVPGTRGAGRC